jgi:fibronectin-binding autotransporter adhesin
MKTKPSQTNRNFSVLGSLLLLAGLSSLKAASGTWTSDSSGNWRDTTKWLGGTVADGTGNTADFSTINLTADRTVTLDAPHTLSTLKFGDVVPDYNWILSGANILTLGTTPVINVVNQTATISSVIAGTAFTRIGAGALTLNGLAVNTFTGTLALNSGTTTEDFSNLATPTDLVKNTVVLAMGGGTLSVNGAASVTSAQTFASTTLSAGGGGAIVLASGASGTANLTLGAITRNAGTALILTLPATGNIKTSSGTAAQVLTGGTTALPYAFITDAAGNLLDYAGVSGTTPFNIGLGSTVAAAQYVTTTGAGLYSINAGGGIVDVTTAGGCTGIAWSSSTPSWNGVRFNAPPTTGPWLIQPSNKNINLGALLITTNVGPNNVTTGTTGAIDNNGTRDFVLAQDNPYGELQWNGNGEFRGGSDLVKIGRGTIVCGSGLSQGFTGNPGVYVNGGVFAVNVNANFGAGGTGAAIDLNGGTAMGMVTLTLDNAGLNKRNINLLGNGGGLAAAAGTVLTVDGVVGGAAGTGPLVIGIPASSANGNIAGLLPGTGSIANGQTFNTANTTAVNATGTVALTGANTYTGGTILYTGTAQINGINNFGGANFGGLTFNGGTLQYASGATGFGSLDMSSATAAKSITLASGGGTMDMNGNPISYANAIGNSGTGTLLVTDTAGGGSLTLNGAGTYTGATTVGDGTHTVALNVNSTLASSGVTVNSSATLGGSGTISGNVIWVNGSSAKLTQGSPMTVSGTVAFNDTGSGNTITVLASGLTTGNYTLLTASSVTGTINPVPAGTGIVAAGYVGTLSIVGGNSVVLAVVAAGTTSSWTDANHGADDNWSDAVNWNNGVPHLAQDTAIFGSGGVGNPVNLDVAETVGGISFTNAAGSYTISGANTLTLDNSGSGAAINVTAGTANAINTAVALSDNLTVTANSGKTVTLGGIVANTGASKTLTVNGGGTVVLSQANTYGPSAGTLGTTLGGTTVQVGTSTSLGSGDVSVTSSSTIKAGAASLTIANNIGVSSLQTATVDNSIASGNNLTLTTGVISGSGGVTKTSDGTLTLGGANTYSGGTIISAGVLSISADGASGGSAGNLGVVPASATANNISLNGGDLLASTTLALHANRGINAVATGLLDAAGSQTLTVSGIIAGNNLTINSVAPTPGTVVLGAANTLNGTTLISAGTLTLGNTLALQNSTLNYSAGTVGLGSLTTLTLGGLSGTQNFGLTNASGAAVALTVDGNGGTTGFTGILNGTGSLDKTGTGGLTIGSGGSGGAAYTGVTAVDNGTLTLGGSTTMSST